MCDRAKFDKLLEDMPDEVREYLEQHFEDGHFCMPGPWMMFGLWGHGHDLGADEEASSDDIPDEVKQWFHEHFGGRFKGHHFCPPGPWMFRRRPRRHRHRHFCPPGPWMFGHIPWVNEETPSDVPDEVKQWFHERFGDWFKGCPSWAQGPPESPAEEAPAEAAG